MNHPSGEIISLYRRHFRAWTEARGTKLIERSWLDRFLRLMPANTEILDIGCGSGVPIARYFSDQGFSVTGVDSAPEMIALFQNNLSGQETVIGDMRTLALERQYGGLIAWDSFFHLSPDDQRDMFRVFQKHALPLAALMFTSGPVRGEVVGSLEGDPLYHASLDGAEYRNLLNQTGFRVIAQVNEDENCDGRTVWLAQHAAA